MSRIKIFVESQDEKTWEEICDEVATGKTNYIDFRGVVFNRVKRGHWIPRYDEWLSKRMGEPYRSKEEWYAEECECSVCNGAMVMQEDWKYCRYCGAKMDEEVQ